MIDSIIVVIKDEDIGDFLGVDRIQIFEILENFPFRFPKISQKALMSLLLIVLIFVRVNFVYDHKFVVSI